MRQTAHVATTRQLRALYPGLGSGSLGTAGVYIGRDCHGGSFAYDPWELYRAGLVTGPNMLVIGQIGRGKSALIKTYAFRQLAFGRQVVLLDPKGENGPLCEAAHTTPIRLCPGGAVRLNPLDGDVAGRASQRVQTVVGIVTAALQRPLSSLEVVACEAAVAAAGARPTLRTVVAAMLAPGEAAARLAHCSHQELAETSREAALGLRRLVEGDLCGMFDGETTEGLDLRAPLVSFDLSELYQSPALGVLMLCITAWLQAAEHRGDRRRVVVLDEAWAVLRDPATARWLQAGYKLARATGTQYVAILHRLSDLLAAGDAGSAQLHLARGLIADSETVVVYAQPASELGLLTDLLDLNDAELACVEALPRGVGLWRVGRRAFLVEHRLGRAERVIVDTDVRMRA